MIEISFSVYRYKKLQLTEEHQEGKAVEDQDVGDMSDTSLGQQQHLLLSGAHEEKTTSIQQEGRQELETVGILSIAGDGICVSQDETDFDDASDTSSHQGVAKDTVDHGTEMQLLRVATHGPASNGNDDGGNQVALGTATAVAAQPHAQETSTPPDNTHTSMLQVIAYPRSSPSVLGEGIHAAPRSDDHAVVEFLRAAGATQPDLTNEEQDGVDNAVGDESGTHDEVGGTLTGVVALTEAQGSDSTKQHLDPGGQRDDLAQYTVSRDNPLPNLAHETTLNVELKIDAHGGLSEDHHHQPRSILRVYVLAKLATFVGVTEEVA